MYLGKVLFYKHRNDYRSFGFRIKKYGYLYSEYEFRIDFYKWSIGVVW